jgi:tRNA A-37 threonylcarbamoyl transferase component Bud32
MLLTLRNLSSYLLSKALISELSIVDGDLSILDVSGRNRNFKVVRRRAQSYFVKQLNHFDPQSIAMLQCEAACYWLAQNDAQFAALKILVPRLVSLDIERQILVTELVSGGDNLSTCFHRSQNDQIALARYLGQALGTYHTQLDRNFADGTKAAIFPRQMPWILSADRRNSGPFRDLTRGTAELLDLVDQIPALCEGLQRVSGAWRTDTLIHGDMRLSNVVLREEKRGERSLVLVDWELCDVGDKRWDLGALVQALLSFSIASHSLGPENSALNGDAWSGGVLTHIPRAFWAGYFDRFSVSPADGLAFVAGCVEFAAARLIQAAYEQLQLAPAFSRNAQAMVRLSSELFMNAREASQAFLEQDL